MQFCCLRYTVVVRFHAPPCTTRTYLHYAIPVVARFHTHGLYTWVRPGLRYFPAIRCGYTAYCGYRHLRLLLPSRSGWITFMPVSPRRLRCLPRYRLVFTLRFCVRHCGYFATVVALYTTLRLCHFTPAFCLVLRFVDSRSHGSSALPLYTVTRFAAVRWVLQVGFCGSLPVTFVTGYRYRFHRLRSFGFWLVLPQFTTTLPTGYGYVLYGYTLRFAFGSRFLRGLLPRWLPGLQLILCPVTRLIHGYTFTPRLRYAPRHAHGSFYTRLRYTLHTVTLHVWVTVTYSTHLHTRWLGYTVPGYGLYAHTATAVYRCAVAWILPARSPRTPHRFTADSGGFTRFVYTTPVYRLVAVYVYLRLFCQLRSSRLLHTFYGYRLPAVHYTVTGYTVRLPPVIRFCGLLVRFTVTTTCWLHAHTTQLRGYYYRLIACHYVCYLPAFCYVLRGFTFTVPHVVTAAWLRLRFTHCSSLVTLLPGYATTCYILLLRFTPPLSPRFIWLLIYLQFLYRAHRCGLYTYAHVHCRYAHTPHTLPALPFLAVYGYAVTFTPHVVLPPVPFVRYRLVYTPVYRTVGSFCAVACGWFAPAVRFVSGCTQFTFCHTTHTHGSSLRWVLPHTRLRGYARLYGSAVLPRLDSTLRYRCTHCVHAPLPACTFTLVTHTLHARCSSTAVRTATSCRVLPHLVPHCTATTHVLRITLLLVTRTVRLRGYCSYAVWFWFGCLQFPVHRTHAHTHVYTPAVPIRFTRYAFYGSPVAVGSFRSALVTWFFTPVYGLRIHHVYLPFTVPVGSDSGLQFHRTHTLVYLFTTVPLPFVYTRFTGWFT